MDVSKDKMGEIIEKSMADGAELAFDGLLATLSQTNDLAGEGVRLSFEEIIDMVSMFKGSYCKI